MLQKSNLGEECWSEAAHQAEMLYNRTPTQEVPSTFKNLRGKKPSLHSVRVFECLTYARVPDALRKKLQDKAIRTALMGTTPGNQHKVLDLDSGDIYYVRHAQFNETVFLNYGTKLYTYEWPKALTANE